MTWFGDIAKIDSKVTLGLLSVDNSLAYRVHEIEKHLHSAGSWFGQATAPSGTTHVADRIASGISAFQMDAGNDDWGAWINVLGSTDTPARTGQAKFDPHLMFITDAEEEVPYAIQFSRGASGDAGVTAGTYTELMVGIDATKKFKTETPIQTGRAAAGDLLWARCLAIGKITGTMDFYLGIHEYVG